MATFPFLNSSAVPETSALTTLRPDTQIYYTLLSRYLSNPNVSSFLLDSSPRPIPPPSLIRDSISYACLYDLHPSLARNRQQPVLEEGNLMLLTGIYDGIATGYLFSRNNVFAKYGLADTREAIGETGLSMQVKTRRFATDLRRAQGEEYVEFGWMMDDSLIVACRRIEPGRVGGGMVLTAELLFFDKPELLNGMEWFIPQGKFGPRRLLRMMSCTENYNASTNVSMFATQPQGQIWRNNNVDGIVGTWSNFAQRAQSLSQSGSFKVRWWTEKKAMDDFDLFAKPNMQDELTPGMGDLELFLEKRTPIKYHFVCGTDFETTALIGLFLAQREQVSGACRDDRFITDPEGEKLKLLGAASDGNGLENDTKGLYYDTSFPAHYVQELQDSPISSTKSSSQFEDEVFLTDTSDALIKGKAEDPVTELARECGLDVLDLTGNRQCVKGSKSSINMSMNGKSSAAALINLYQNGTIRPHKGKQITISIDDNRYTLECNEKGRPLCPKCGKDFPKPGNVKRHIITVHEGRKNYFCPICGKPFGHKTHRDRHIKSHTPELPYACKWCQARFRSESQLEGHETSVHKVEDGKPTRANEYICQQCGKAFAQKSNLTRHIAGVHEQKRYPCSYCSQTFGQPFDRKRHEQNKHRDMILA